MGKLFIGLTDNATIKQGQTVFVSYEAPASTGTLKDDAGNYVESFTQIVNNSSTAYNDKTAPTVFSNPSINADGQSVTINFSEALDRNSLQSVTSSSFRLFVDGKDRAATFNIDNTQFDASGSSVCLLYTSPSPRD